MKADNKIVKVRIPATTANMGPGFDALGMALNIYNDIEIEERRGETIIYNDGLMSQDDYKKNMIYTSLARTLDKYGYEYDGFIIKVLRCDIPICRGLGSSSACIVGGIYAANSLMGNIMSMDEVISLATEIEGHPDNVVPAAVGGMVASLVGDGKVNYSKVNVPKKIRFISMIPSFMVSTEMARGVMPSIYSKEDIVFNISRSAMLISALNNEELDKLRYCFGDRIHQPYRKTLIENSDAIFDKANEFGALGEFISGSGSTLMAVVSEDEAERFRDDMEEFLSQLDGNWRVKILEPDFEGVRIVA
ncbi:MAG: homoserine kinase [Clostridiaceae bacterium]